MFRCRSWRTKSESTTANYKPMPLLTAKDAPLSKDTIATIDALCADTSLPLGAGVLF